MNKKIILPISSMLLVGLAVFVSAGMLIPDVRDKVESYVTINQGWNIIHGFYDPNQLSGGEIEPKNIKAIYVLIAMNQQYVRVYPNPEVDKLREMGDVDDQLQHVAFWVYSDKGGRTEYEFEKPISLDKLALFKGWNFIGITPDFWGKSLNELSGNCHIERVYAFQEGSWYSLTDSMNEKLFDNDKAKMHGLVIKVSNEYCFLGESSLPELPDEELEPLPILPNGEEKCTDSDGGKDIYTKGTIRGISLTSKLTTETDYCIEGTLIEFFCNDETNNITPLNRINNNGVTCPSGYRCADGACIR
jgi:hypothetical protein